MPKQFLTLAGKPVIRHAAEALARPRLAAATGWRGRTRSTGRWPASPACCPSCPGGATRQDSVRAGLEALAPFEPDIVLVHDAARPVIPEGTVPALLAALRDLPGAIPAAPVADTLKRVVRGVITETVPRAGLFRAQTPQAFRFQALLDAHRSGLAGATDDASLLEAAGQQREGRARLRRQHQADLSGRSGPAGAYHGGSAGSPRRHRLRRACVRSRASLVAVRRARCRMTRAWPATPTPMSASTLCATRSTARWPRAISGGISRRARRTGRTPTARGS